MKRGHLIRRSLTHYWRTNVAVVIGVATAVAVLTGALLVGDSVRGSLRDLALGRLGRVDLAILSTGFVRDRLAGDLRSDPRFTAVFEETCPIVVMQGFVTEPTSNRRASQVLVYGVDDRFWQFQRVSRVHGPVERDVLISQALAEEIGAQSGEAILVRVQRPSAIPVESVFGRKDDLGRTLRSTVSQIIAQADAGDFSLAPQQGRVRAVFLPLDRLRGELELGDRVNTVLVAAKERSDAGDAGSAKLALEQLLKARVQLDDLNLRLRVLDAPHAVALEAESGLLSDAEIQSGREALSGTGIDRREVFTYLANGLRVRDRETPYSLVSAIDLEDVLPGAAGKTADVPPIVLTEWAANDLKAAVGDSLVLEYYRWEGTGQMATQAANFRVAGVVPTGWGDRDLAPRYPGITESASLADWDPPFRIDLRKVRPIDEEFWKTYRTTPKAFVPLAIGQQLWSSRYGSLTSIRMIPDSGRPLETLATEFGQRLRANVDPLAMGLTVRDVRGESLAASRGATDFGEYFVYFSFFLVASALLLAALFFKLTIEQRSREIGLLRAVGLGPAAVRRLFLTEGIFLAVVGSFAGALGGIGYGRLMMSGLRSWWVDAVGTTALTLHVSSSSVVAGTLSGIVAAVICIWGTLRGLGRLSERDLLAGQLSADLDLVLEKSKIRAPTVLAIVFGILGGALATATFAGLMNRTAGFFGAGAALLVACLGVFALWLRMRARHPIESQGWLGVSRLGLRNARYRPARSVLSIAVIAAATFILISVEAFRRPPDPSNLDRHSGIGGYSLIVESLLPIVHDPNTREGREALGISALDSVRLEPFRLLPGDDASCLNLYQPTSPRIMAPTDAFLDAGRFAFRASLGRTDAQRVNPWLLLNEDLDDGAVPVVADANSMTYVLHKKLGDDIEIVRGDRKIKLRLVAALDDSLFQRELLMSTSHFLKLFPERQGYGFLLVETPPERAEAVAATLEDALVDFGADATLSAQRLAEFHRVENTYLSTFQMLGGLGLLLGTLGLGAVLLRNVLERRRELALLRALGYREGHFAAMVVAENVLLLGSGLLSGVICALIAIAPVWIERGGSLPVASLTVLLAAVLVVGLMASIGATIASLRSPLLPALRAE